MIIKAHTCSILGGPIVSADIFMEVQISGASLKRNEMQNVHEMVTIL